MTAAKVHILGLLSLRALSEYDPYEFKRSTDLSRREIDRKIEDYLTKTDDYDCQRFYAQMKSIGADSETPLELEHLFRQLYAATYQDAQHEALQIVKQYQHRTQQNESREVAAYSEASQATTPAASESELARLSVMCMLRTLRDYRAEFERRVAQYMIDCVLVPIATDGRPILVEIKGRRRSNRAVINRLRHAMEAYGTECFGVMVTERDTMSDRTHVDEAQPMSKRRIFVLPFNMRKNAFVGHHFDELVAEIFSDSGDEKD
jgi:hypothetical protein